MKPRSIMWTLIVFSVLSQSVFAQAPTSADVNALRAEMDALKADYDKRIQMLESQLQALQNQLQSASAKPETPAEAGAPQQQQQQPAATAAQVPAGAQGASGPGGALPVYAVTDASKVFNPDIAVIGDFLGAIGSNKVNPDPALQMHESEVSLQAILDPYARADFFLSFGQEGVDLEEGYLTFPALPGGLLMRVGKMRAAFGKV